MRVQTEEWRRFIPGMRMYKGMMTLFYNGETLYDDENHELLVYNDEERQKWEVIMVLPGVEIIPESTFQECRNIKVVRMSDSVRRIEHSAFNRCDGLLCVQLSTNLEYIGEYAFYHCISLPSIFIPPSCREIDASAFRDCESLIILSVPRHTTLGNFMIEGTALARASHFETDEDGHFSRSTSIEVNEWIKRINGDTDEYALHRACSSFNPIVEIIHEIVTRQGLKAFHTKNEIGISPLQYLNANMFAEKVDQRALMKRYVLEMMGDG